MTRLRRPSRSTRAGLLLLIASVAVAGCADRSLLTRPDTEPGGGTWLTVWFALALVTILSGVLLTLPVWRSRRGSRLAVSEIGRAHV